MTRLAGRVRSPLPGVAGPSSPSGPPRSRSTASDVISHSAQSPDPPPFDLSREADFELDSWRVEPSRLVLRRGDEEGRIEPRVMALLVTLARQPREVLSRQELLETAWADVIVGDEALTMAVSKLRRALGKRRDGGDFLETVPRVGYRLLVEPRPVEESSRGPEIVPQDVPEPATERRSRVLVPSLVALALPGVAAVVLGGLVLRSGSAPESPPSRAPTPLETVTLTTHRGLESQASLDPNGRRLAYQRFGDEGNGLVVLDLETRESRFLVEGRVHSPSWSPRDQRIAFLHSLEGDDATAFRLSVAEASSGRTETLLTLDRVSPLSGIGWTADATGLAWAQAETPTGAHAIRRLDLATGAVDAVTEPPEGILGDSRPAFSPDGRLLAFTRGRSVFSHDLWLRDLASGAERQLTADECRIWGFAWDSGSDRLVLASNRGGAYQLWWVTIDGGTPEWLPIPDDRVRFPEIRGSLLVYDAFDVATQLVELRAGSLEKVELQPSSSRARETAPSWSPDGTTLAFASDRSGSGEIFLWKPSTGRTSRLTSLEASVVFALDWSPDGTRLVTHQLVRGQRRWTLVEVPSGRTEDLPVPDVPGPEWGEPVFSSDGRAVFVSGGLPEGPSVWRVPLAGDEPARRLEVAGAMSVRRGRGEELRILTASGAVVGRRGSEDRWEVLLEGLRPVVPHAWDVADGTVHSLESEDGQLVWRRWSLATGESEELGRFEPPLANGGFEMHPSGASALVARYLPLEGDLRMVDLATSSAPAA